MYRPPPRVSAGMKALAVFWAVLLLLGSAGAAWLQLLGPPGERVAAAPEPEPAPPPPVASPEPPRLPPMPSVVSREAPPGPAQPTPETPLAVAEPDPALIERLREGSLPRVADDGRAAWRTYARPFDQADRRPRIGLLVAGLGISQSATEQAIERLPGAVTLAFSPYGLRLAEFAAQARADGHEVLVGIPMEPVGFPLNDPGPYALLTGLPWGENNQRLLWVLSRFPGYVGATNVLGPTLRGERFSASPEAMRPMLEVLATRGLLFVEARPGEAPPQGIPGRAVDVLVDERPVRAEIEQRLADLEKLARERGAALGLSGSSPLALDRISAWASGVEARGFVLAPVSALAGEGGRQAQR
ncbi:divergent polysaccharide deacetylase family protein [Elioraea rosea]|uniref:divergent polysaccharide deacetylase family protein n=1 Tax=Elioraea rosea TaxID=2492390 RepID=UPI0011828175|nr:divergent polysaccharide deacetylase family protein [Elioraea rosea]